jgi:hypothetical protein
MGGLSLFAGRGDLEDDLRMLTSIGAKFIGRSLCLWGGEAALLDNLEKAKQQVLVAVEADPEMLLEACIFEIVTTQVEQVAVPGWAFSALGRPVEKRNFRYVDMLYPDGRHVDHRARFLGGSDLGGAPYPRRVRNPHRQTDPLCISLP